jgi:hypothetical protein
MGESQSLSNFSGGSVAPTELPAATPTAQRKRPPVLPKPAYGTGHPPSLILNHNPSMIVTTLRTQVQDIVLEPVPFSGVMTFFFLDFR